MKVLLIKDVYKLGRAGDVKRVADGFGRNFLLPQGLAVLATPGALKQVDHIRTQANARRAIVNKEMSGVADILSKVTLYFPAKAGETGKLNGTMTTQDVATALQGKARYEVKRQQMDMQPIRELGVFTAHVRLTMDLVPEIKILVHREGEAQVATAEEEQAKPKRKGKKAEEAAPAEAAEETPQATEA